jgi:glycosyltransferase involved in cell wall biosynthesis
VNHLILFLEQQSTRAGAQRVLDEVLRSLDPEFRPLVAFPDDGPYVDELRARNIETLTYPLGRYRSGPKSLRDMMVFPARSLYCGYRLADVIRERDVRLVYINGPRTLVAGVLAARLTGRPSLFHLHLTMTRRADILVASPAARRTTKIVACSKTTAAALVQDDDRLGAKTQVIYNPVRKPFAHPVAFPSQDHTRSDHAAPPARSIVTPPGVPVVGLVGRITPGKGHHVLLDAASGLARNGRDIQVVFVGAPDPTSNDDEVYLRRLKTSVRALGLESRVHWAGYQADPDPYYATFDVLVMPSTVREGLGLVALEAMQCGVPVVGSGLGAIPEIVHDGVNGLLFPAGDSAALAKCLDRLLGDSELRSRLQAGARVSVDDRFSVDTFRARIRQVLLELCPLSETSGVEAQVRPPAGTRA